MAPGGGGKRKRPDRTFSQEGPNQEGTRPSPHRPQELRLGQQSTHYQGQQSHAYGRDQYDHRGGGRRRGSRGGRGSGSQRSPLNSPSAVPLSSRIGAQASPPMSPSLPSSEPPTEAKQEAPLQELVEEVKVARKSEPQPDATPYDYEYVTDERIGAWVDKGRNDILKAGQEACFSQDVLGLGILFQELVEAGTTGRLDATEAGLIIKDIVEITQADHDAMVKDEVIDTKSTFLDCLSNFVEFSEPAPKLKDVVLATGISAEQMRYELEESLLIHAGLVRSTFKKMGIRKQTDRLYRQSNYNLLREETEGYSKLFTELFTTSNNEPPTSEVVEETFERVMGMVGAFNLDVGRVLDISLDVFAAVLVKQYRFFVKFFRASSWWPQERYTSDLLSPIPRWALPGSLGGPLTDEEKLAMVEARNQRDIEFWRRCKEIGMAAFFEIGGRRTEKSELDGSRNNNNSGSRDEENNKWIEITRTLPPPGNRVAAQVLGFKLRYYSSTARDSTDQLPPNLVYLAALLVKVGFISLKDLYPHIWPEDSAMETVREEKMREKAEREKLNRPGGGAMNALLAAGALPDDTIDTRPREATRLREVDSVRKSFAKNDPTTEKSTPAPQPEENGTDLPEPSDQKVHLLKSLLCIGALPEALYMLGRFPWLPDAFPDLPEYIHRIIHHSFSQIYESLRPQVRDNLRTPQEIPTAQQPVPSKGQVSMTEPPLRKTMRWAQLDKEDASEAIDYKFYWDDWSDSIPVCQTVDDVFTICSTLLNYSGVKIGQDPDLLIKLVRIGKHSLSGDFSETNQARWLDLSKRLLVPALSITTCNPGVVNEVWELIERFPTQTRFSIYAEWYQGQISRLPDIKSAFDQAKAETKDVLKRISKTTIKPMARALAKVAYASPGIVFQVAITQLESYENIVEAVVECARYFTYLAYDVLIWSLMTALGGTGRRRVQADGMLTSKWLAALSLFAGKVFRRYSFMNPTPIIQYVTDQLKRGNSSDLVVLEEITKSMAGIIADTSLNRFQIVAMSGGEVLQAQTLLQLQDKRHESKLTAKRLIRSLTESGLTGRVLVLLAQERQTGIYKVEEQDAHPKLLGNLFDQLHSTLVHYVELLRSNLSVKDFDAQVPSISQLAVDFGIEPSVAFWISRPSLLSAMVEYDARHGRRYSNKKRSASKSVADGLSKPESKSSDEEAKPDKAEVLEDEILESSVGVMETINGNSDEAAIKNADDDPANIATSALIEAANVQQPWHPVLEEVIDAVRPILPDEVWATLSRSFYVTFWQLSLREVKPPMQSYRDEGSRLSKKIEAIDKDRSNMSAQSVQQKNKDKNAIMELQLRLSKEGIECLSFHQHTHRRLQHEKEHWFSDHHNQWDSLNVALIEHCFFPRMVISPTDALYAFNMLKLLHSLGTPNFRTMGFMDQFFREKRLTSMMFLCSAKEAESFGRFLNEVLEDLNKWHGNRKLFEKEAFGANKELYGYAKKITKEGSIVGFYEFEDFRRIVLKWHRALNGALKACIGSGEYMHVRNAINVLNGIHQQFPVVNWMGMSLLNSISELSHNESREDLKVAATSLIGGLKRCEKDWVLPQAFALASTDGAPHTNGVRSASAKPSTPRPEESGGKTLDPNAPEFKPNAAPTTNGALAPPDINTNKIDAEDGEIEDAKMSDAPIPQVTAPGALHDANMTAVRELEIHNNKPSPVPFEARNPSPISDKDQGTITFSAEKVATETSSTPARSSQASLPSRPDSSRNASSMSNRAQHDLPSKPDTPQTRPADHRIPPRPSDRGPQEHIREPRFPERGGLRATNRDRLERITSSSHAYSHERVNERAHPNDRDRVDSRFGAEKPPLSRPGYDDRHGGPTHSRDARQPPRDDRLDRPLDSRGYPEYPSRRDLDGAGQDARDSAMPPPRSNVMQHPERAAMIQGGQSNDRGHPPDRRSDLPRNDAIHPERRSRGPSPIRGEERLSARYENRRDDRPPHDGRRPLDDTVRPRPARFEEPHAPTGPRTGRLLSNAATNPNDRFRDSMKPSVATPSVDPNHGRLNQDQIYDNRQAESQYGRLNADTDIPSGPRLPNGNQPPPNRGGRNVSASQPLVVYTQQAQAASSDQSQISASPAQDRRVPSGPLRTSPRKSVPLQQVGTNSAPPTPVAQSPETAGIHPDRLKALQESGPFATENAPQSQGRGSRQPPPVPMPAPDPPRGPNAQLPSPIGPAANRGGPPTGPAMSSDRNGRDKRFAGIQGVLQQANQTGPPERSGQGASIRGRGGRANSVIAPLLVTSGPPTPGLPKQDQPPPRDDLFAGRPNGTGAPPYVEEDAQYGRGATRGPPRDGPREGERRSARNRTPEQEQHRSREGPRAGDGSYDRDYRGEPVPPEVDLRGGRPPRDTRRLGRDEGQYRERDPRDAPLERRDERDRRDGVGGRKRGRGDDESQGGRNFSDKRPRR